MHIEPFGVEIWMNAHETRCRYNLAETCVDSLTVAELLRLCGQNETALEALLSLKLTYGEITGSERLRRAIAALYDGRAAESILVTHGTIGANALVYQALVSRGDHVVSLVPTYQQHVSIPESLGAEVSQLELRPEDGYLPDIDRLRALMRPETRLIALTNPNNPTGALMDEALLQEVISLAREAGAWLLADEVYRSTDQAEPGMTASVADLYEKGISTSGMSKAFSLAGLRLGWIAAPDAVLEAVSHHRDYTTISVGMIDDHLAAIALEGADRILARSRAITRTNLRILEEWAKDEPRITFTRPGGGTTALLRYDGTMGSEAFCLALLEETGVLLTPGAAMGAEGHLRIGYACATTVLREGLEKLSAFIARQG
ncbi:aminotransferase [Pseudoroseicyclus aestuarii]|uniref:Aminotransferase n=1 Tax=Pseudoroseicyclus aestuarii TaxID=1795041 RepID=A0A318SUM7_9RHOB|nr:aminotransferase [Pseudoroseicyclus aestuarii]PYE85611.1 aspartate/methionine/tyrosine aminotransferase [Pseudoroseicyclus aestuarii]